MSEGVRAPERPAAAVLVNPLSIRHGPVRGHGTHPEAWKRVAADRRRLAGTRKRCVSRTVQGAKRDAQAQLNRLLVEVGDRAPPGTHATVGELLERWLAVASPDWSPKTVLETRRFLDRLVLPRFGATPLRKLTTAALDRSTSTSGSPAAWAAGAGAGQRATRPRRGPPGAAAGSEVGLAVDQPAANATLPRVPRVDIQPGS